MVGRLTHSPLSTIGLHLVYRHDDWEVSLVLLLPRTPLGTVHFPWQRGNTLSDRTTRVTIMRQDGACSDDNTYG